MEDIILILTSLSVAFAIAAVVLFLLYRKLAQKNKENEQTVSKYRQDYDAVINVDEEAERRRLLYKQEMEGLESDKDQASEELAQLKGKYIKAKELYDAMHHEMSIYEEVKDLREFGIYEPHFDFDTSEKFKEQILKNRELQKLQVKDGWAVVCDTVWTVGNSKAEGRKMTKRYEKLMLRAFNGECDSQIAKTRWNNVTQVEARINKAFEIINKLGETHQIRVTSEYLDLKIKELHLTYEYERKKQDEKEEQRRIRAEIAEEQKAIREREKAIKDAEKEEKQFQKALEKARKELGLATGEELEKLNAQIAEMEVRLKEAESVKERAISMAQQTKAGHVYVISNIGSFGHNVFKIGMTRRLEPMDRVKELGDASVPFNFDVHAMIYSDNAPELENMLHKEFADQRLNWVNNRREFFKVNLEDIERIVRETNSEIEFIKEPEAQEYRESQELKKRSQQAVDELEGEQEVEAFPEADELFN